MAYDIFGQPLRPGYCEVHPDVPEPYPCYVCLQEYAYHQQEQEMYRQQEPEYSMEDEMEYLRRQRKTDQKLIEEQAAQLKAAEAREARLREGLVHYARQNGNYYTPYGSPHFNDGGLARSLLEVKDD